MGYSGFPAYSRLRTIPSPVRGAAPLACQGDSYLRHSVTSDVARTMSVQSAGRSFLFCRPPHVAMRVGPYLHSIARVPRVWPLRGQSLFATTSLLITRTRRIVTG